MAISTIDSSGLAAGAVAQVDIATNVVGTGPVFFAYPNANQTVSANTWTKLVLNSEIFDSNNNFDAVTNYRFTPTVAGYYQLNCSALLSGSAINGYIAFYKNGSLYTYGNTTPTGGGGSNQILIGSVIAQANGSTDYFEIYVYTGGTSILGGSSTTSFCGVLVRAA